MDLKSVAVPTEQVIETMPDQTQSSIPLRFNIVSVICSLMIAVLLVGLLDSIHAGRLAEMTVGQLSTGLDEGDRHVLCVDLETAGKCLHDHSGWNGRTILWLGNSQLPTINAQQPGDRTMVELLHDAMIDQGDYVFGFAPPNANLQEHFVLFEYLADKVRPDMLLLPVFFDDLRESGIRPQLQNIFDDPATVARLQDSEFGRRLLDEHTAFGQASAEPAAQSSPSTMDLCEDRLNTWLESASESWQHRGNYRSTVFVKLHHLRNAAFGINPQTVRRMIPARYERNMQALIATIAAARVRGVDVLLYVPPIRQDVPIPYEMAAYDEFKKLLRQFARNENLAFADLENVVNGDEWGLKTARLWVATKSSTSCISPLPAIGGWRTPSNRC